MVWGQEEAFYSSKEGTKAPSEDEEMNCENLE